jgi:cytochrome c553
MNKSYCPFLGAIIVLATATAAQPSFAQSVDTAKGQQRAAVCTACHGQDGSTTASPGIPRLAGQDRDYLIKALTAYRVDALPMTHAVPM